MPPVTNLREGMNELNFKLRFDDIDAKKYHRVADEIEKRLAQCTFYDHLE